MIEKRVLVAERVRRPPGEGFSWVDRRFLREHAPALSRDAILLYFFLAAASDKDGLSFYAEATAAALLKMDVAALVRARDELRRHELVAHEAPLTQVLSLPVPERPRLGGLVPVGEVVRFLLGRGRA